MLRELPLAKRPYVVLINLDDVVFVLPHRKGCKVFLKNKSFVSRIDYDKIFEFLLYRDIEIWKIGQKVQKVQV